MSLLLETMMDSRVPVTGGNVLTLCAVTAGRARRLSYLGDLVYMAAKSQYKTFSLDTFGEVCDRTRESIRPKEKPLTTEQVLDRLFNARG